MMNLIIFDNTRNFLFYIDQIQFWVFGVCLIFLSLALKSVETGLGGGGGETIVNALWFLLLSWTALRVREFPRVLNYLGVVIGVVGILSVILASVNLMSVYGLGLIIWFVWLGITMLRRSPNLAA